MATDGSEEANLAASSAADLAKSTNSELHVVSVGHVLTILYASPEAIVLDPDLQSKMEEDTEQETKNKLEEQVQQIGDAGIEVAGAHTTPRPARGAAERSARTVDGGSPISSNRVDVESFSEVRGIEEGLASS